MVLIFHFSFAFSRPKLSFQLEYIVAEKFRGGWGDSAPVTSGEAMGERVLGIEQGMESDLTWDPQGSSVRMENKVITDRRSKVIVCIRDKEKSQKELKNQKWGKSGWRQGEVWGVTSFEKLKYFGLSQQFDFYRNTKAKCSVVSWIESWNSKRIPMKNLVKIA